MYKLLSVMLLLAATWPALADETTYRKHIRPVWEDKCERCHGASAPDYANFMKNPRQYELDDKGPRMDSYESLLFFVKGPEAGLLMLRLDDGGRDGQPGNMYRLLGRKEERKENLALFKKWIGEEAWILKKTSDITQEDLQRITAKE